MLLYYYKNDYVHQYKNRMWRIFIYGTGTKKMLNMLILDIVKEYSDSEHRLKQQDIIRTNILLL